MRVRMRPPRKFIGRRNYSPPLQPARASADVRDRLVVITCHWNPCRWRRLRETFYEWRASLGNLPLCAIELVTDGGPQEIAEGAADHLIVIRGDASNVMWQKEAMLNAAIRQMQGRYEFVAWVDHDVLLDDPRWPDGAVRLLERKPRAIQLWGAMDYLSRDGSRVRTAKSAAAILAAGGYPSTGPGAAWCARIESMIMLGGLYDRNIVGGGDLAWFHGLTGARMDYLERMGVSARRHAEAWCARVRGRLPVTFLPIGGRHLWHGEHDDRQYVSRDRILRRHGFDPARDIRSSPSGVLAWTEHASARLRKDITDYFHARREDG